MTRIFRFAIANVTAEELAAAGQAAKLSGTVLGSGLGFGEWGIEPTVMAEIAGDYQPVREFVESLLGRHGESAAYVTVDGHNAQLWYTPGYAPRTRPL